ncbi:MAG: hypothetical protein EVA41_00925 [Flavobacteriales bacterium]|nr:MAG: hypothetical protein EVA41_00925 [Flavobacteriales bacterium]CAI8305958.1 MAG: Xanthine phosphoribosyltransferase [Flavobacteriales bacterium]|tara:strand:- start:696 stop:1130 length:435 start_codon:yes stop_codon:yes gene_type:complete
MKKSIISVDEIKYALKEIVKQIDISGFNPEIIVSINRGGCIPGVYLSHFLNKPHKMVDIKSIDNQKISVNTLKKFKSALIIDDINDTGKTFTIVKETFDNTNADIRYAALINNISSKTKIEYHGQIINKKENPIWYVFPWENWW